MFAFENYASQVRAIVSRSLANAAHLSILHRDIEEKLIDINVQVERPLTMKISDQPASERQLLKTTTGEILHPIRLFYDLFNKQEMVRIFQKLGCIDFDPARRRWCWVYAREARSLKFKHSYNDLPKEARRLLSSIS